VPVEDFPEPSTHHNGEAEISEGRTATQERNNPINRLGDFVRQSSKFVVKKKERRPKSCDSAGFDFILPYITAKNFSEFSTHDNNRTTYGAKKLPVPLQDLMDTDLHEATNFTKVPPSTRQTNQDTRSSENRTRLNPVGSLFGRNSNTSRKPPNPPQQITRSNSWTSLATYENDQEQAPDKHSHFQRFFGKRAEEKNESSANYFESPAEANMKIQFRKHSSTNLRGTGMIANSCSSFSSQDDFALWAYLDEDDIHTAEKTPNTTQANQSIRSPGNRPRLNRVGSLFQRNSNPLMTYEEEEQQPPDKQSHFQRFFSKKLW